MGGRVERLRPLPSQASCTSSTLVALFEQSVNSPVESKQGLNSPSLPQQRIETYEASTVPLNADQQRAIAGKPVLEAVIRELNEVREVLKVRLLSLSTFLSSLSFDRDWR